MKYIVEARHVDPLPIAAVRRRARPAELSKVVPDACGEVWNFVRASGIPNTGRMVAVYLDGGRSKEESGSTIVDLARRKPKIVREGPIGRDQIERAIGARVSRA